VVQNQAAGNFVAASRYRAGISAALFFVAQIAGAPVSGRHFAALIALARVAKIFASLRRSTASAFSLRKFPLRRFARRFPPVTPILFAPILLASILFAAFLPALLSATVVAAAIVAAALAGAAVVLAISISFPAAIFVRPIATIAIFAVGLADILFFLAERGSGFAFFFAAAEAVAPAGQFLQGAAFFQLGKHAKKRAALRFAEVQRFGNVHGGSGFRPNLQKAQYVIRTQL
jgi:hypothetical protein